MVEVVVECMVGVEFVVHHNVAYLEEGIEYEEVEHRRGCEEFEEAEYMECQGVGIEEHRDVAYVVGIEVGSSCCGHCTAGAYSHCTSGRAAGIAADEDSDYIDVVFFPYLAEYDSAGPPADDDHSSCRLEDILQPTAFRSEEMRGSEAVISRWESIERRNQSIEPDYN